MPPIQKDVGLKSFLPAIFSLQTELFEQFKQAKTLLVSLSEVVPINQSVLSDYFKLEVHISILLKDIKWLRSDSQIV